jgi:hypothetical protein
MVEETDKLLNTVEKSIEKVKGMEIVKRTQELLTEGDNMAEKIKKELDTDKDGVISTIELKAGLKNSSTLRMLLGGFLTVIISALIAFIKNSFGGVWDWNQLLTILEAVVPISIITKIFWGIFTTNEDVMKKQSEEIYALNNVIALKDQSHEAEKNRIIMQYESKLADKELTNRLLMQKIELQLTK